MTQAIHTRSLFDRLRGLSPLGPIVGKELRTMARRKRNYLLRVAYLGVLLAIMLIAWIDTAYRSYAIEPGVVQRAQQQAELGQLFFGIFALFSVVAMHLIGPVLTSTAIGSERLGKTLNVLLMTPMTTWQIVSGKLFSRLLAAFTLIGLSLPVLAVVRLLGGIDSEDIFGVVGLCAATAASSAALGLLLSTWLNRSYAVILMAYFAQGIIYLLLPLLCVLYLAATARTNGPSQQQMTTLYKVLSVSNPVMTTSVHVSGMGTRGLSVPWSYAIAGQCVMALGLVTLSSLLLRRQIRKEGGAAVTLSALPAHRPIEPPALLDNSGVAPAVLSLAAAHTLGPARAARLVGDNPVLWRELRRPLATRRWQRVAMSIVVMVFLLTTYALLAANGGLDEREAHIGYALVFQTILALLLCVLSATVISGEKESDTWTLLIAAPLLGKTIVLGKLLGVARRALWPTLLIFGHFLLFTIFGVVSIWALLTVVWVTLTFNVVWVATGVYLSLKLRRATTAVVLNLVLGVAVYAGVPIVLSVVSSLFPGDNYDYDAPWRHPEEAVWYYVPHWYLGTSISGLHSPTLDERVRMPLTRKSEPAIDYLWVMFLSGLAQVGVAALIVYWMTSRFDSIVGRAPQRFSGKLFSPGNRKSANAQ